MSVEDWHAHLIAFHREYPDAMAVPMNVLLAPGGVSSYHFFASRLLALVPGARSILDVGCGDGTLLLRLRAAYGDGLQLAGIDLSPADVERARARLPGADIRCGDVAAARYGEGRFDLAVGHLSFALIPDLRQLFSSMFRSLVPAGALAFVIEDPLAESTILRSVGSSLAHLRGRIPDWAASMPKREAWEDDASLISLLREAGFSSDVHVERFVLESQLLPGEVWEIARRFYSLGLLPADLRAEVENVFRQTVSDIDADGRLHANLSLRLIVARRSS